MSNIYAEILERVERGEALTLKTELCGSEGLIAEGLKKTLAPYAPQTDKRGRYFADVTMTETEGKITVGEPFSPPERLIVLGAGHIAVPVCDFAAKSGFEVYVCDDRPAFANTARFPLAREVLCDSFESCIDRLRLTRYDYVVVITRGHVHDADCLREIFKGTQPAYLGIIGSRRRVRGLFEMLVEEGYPKEMELLACAILKSRVEEYRAMLHRAGFRLRAVGCNLTASRFNGIPVKRYMLASFIVSGAIAGLGGGAEHHCVVFRPDAALIIVQGEKIRRGIPQGDRLMGLLRRLTHKGDVRKDAENQPVHRIQGILGEGQVAAPFQIIKNTCHLSHLLRLF